MGGTGVQISYMAKEQEDAQAEMRWRHYRVFDAFVTHAWIEPRGNHRDEVLMRLPFTPEVMQLTMRIVLNRHIGRNITVQARRTL